MELPLRAGSYTLSKLINTCHIYTAHMSPVLNGSFALQRFERSNAIKICNGIMFDFYPGLPHVSLIYRYQHGKKIGSERRWYNVGTLSDEGSKAVEED